MTLPIIRSKDLKGTVLEGTFYKQEIQKVVKNDNIYKIQSFIKNGNVRSIKSIL